MDAALTPPTFELTGTVALVTGGTKGVGHGVVRQLLTAGASVMLTSRTSDDCESVAADLAGEFGPGRVAGQVCDLADLVDPTAVERLLDVAGEQLGPIDVLVANAAATGGHGPLTDTRADGFSRMLGTNVVANFVLARVTAQRMADRAGGSIVFVTSIAAAAPMPGNVAYAASKAGLTSMAMSLAAEYAARGVRVNCVAPGLIRSRASTAAFGGNGALDRYAADRIPTGRVGEAEEVGAACVFLASTAGAYITATVLPVDGGSAGLAGAHGG